MAAPAHDADPPPFLRLAGHPLRWRLLAELARSDRRVSELCELAGRRQSLVSYHLRQLRDGGLVSARRSAFSGRDSYYLLELERCGDLLLSAADALHPALHGSVLFLCTGNSARSQVAQAMCEQLSAGTIAAASAGSQPKPLHPEAVRVMRERGVDISARSSTHLDQVAQRRFGCVVSLCDRVREVCPEFPGAPELIHWSIPDPARETGSDAEICAAFDRMAAELEVRVRFLVEALQRAA